jgi:transaldolase / glucose-6-phosphate isomerase
MSCRAEQLLTLGQSVWLDFIRRGHLVSGEFDALVRDHGVVGVTSNPTIFQQAIASSHDYDDAIRALVAKGLAGKALYEALAIEDIQGACDRLRPVYDRSSGLDGRVSIEVSPALAHDTAGTVEEARRLHAAVARPNVMIKIPSTDAGLPAIEQIIADGISVNVTLIFTLARYAQVLEAYQRGLERRAAAGQPLDGIRSVASFFISRVDSKVDAAIEARAATLPEGASERAELKRLGGQAAVANARLAYELFLATSAAPRWQALAAKGAHAQRPLWASTSTKNAAYPDTLYVDELIGRDTVNTIPPATLTAFNDHGTVADRIGHDLPAAKRLFERLPELGVPVAALIDQLEGEGVSAFAKSFESLLAALETKRAALAEPSDPFAVRGPATDPEGRIAARLTAFDRERFAERLWRRDDALWSADPAHRKVASNRLGWLASPGWMANEVRGLEAFAAEVAADGYTHVVLLGMGGSSLAPETFRLVFGVRRGRLELTVLDDTSPAAVRAVAEAHDPLRTFFLVSSKSGGTIEVTSFEAFFFEWVRRARGDMAGRSFAAITDPGTSLAALAAQRGYRRVFTNPPDIGGRYSALSYFGLVPAALIGAPLEALAAAAQDEAKACGGDVPAARAPGVALGAALGELARAGRDKLTLVLGPELAPLGAWVEQLVAESTGKDGVGILPVEGEPLASPGDYGDDRVFAAVSVKPFDAATTAALAALEAAGHPVLRWSRPDLAGLAGEFVRWEIATAAASVVLGVDPFDEPNVTEAKLATQAVLEAHARDGSFPAVTPLASAGALAVDAPAATAALLRPRAGDTPASWVAALAGITQRGDYVALLAYLHRTPARRERLQRLRLALRAASRRATTVGWGPRFLHSTGQFHKGGGDQGVFLLLTAEEGDLPIPGRPFGFGVLRRAQAEGDHEVLARRGRRVLRVHLGGEAEAGLDALIEAVERLARG